MPTIPAFITTSTLFRAGTSGPNNQWNLVAKRKVPAPSCKNLTDVFAFAFPPESIDATQISVGNTPSAGPAWAASSYTYPDGWDEIWLDAASFVSGGGEWRLMNWQPLDNSGNFGGQLSVEIGEIYAELTLQVQSWGDTKYDGSLFCDGRLNAQLQYDTSPLIDVELAKISGSTFHTIDAGGGHTITVERWIRNGSVSFPKDAQNIRVRFGDMYGQWTKWFALKFKPIGEWTATFEDGILHLDASGVFVLGGNVNDPGFYAWSFSDPQLGSPFHTNEETTDVDLTGSTFTVGENASVFLSVTSNLECASNLGSQSFVFEEIPASQFGSFVDRFNTLYSAVNDGDNVQVSRFKSGASSRELLATIANAKNPSLFQKSSGEIILGATDRASGDFMRHTSANFGRSFD